MKDLRELIGDELQGDEAAAFDALGGIGMSSSSGRDGTDFRLRLTTR